MTNVCSIVPIWDATHCFRNKHYVGVRFDMNNVVNLPRINTDLEFGDLVMVLSFATKYTARNTGQLSLGLTLGGVVLVAKPVEPD